MTALTLPISDEELAWIDLRLGAQTSDWLGHDRRALRSYVTYLLERLNESQDKIQKLHQQMWRMGATK